MPYSHASFFSGIGGFDLGFERAGFEHTFQCEIKEFCFDILSQHWPEVLKVRDITDAKTSIIPSSDVWTAGFPCQDLSLARMGPRDGLRGPQSGLFFDLGELLGKYLPRAVVLENVHGLLTSHRGRDFTAVLKTLDELGYGVAWRVLNSKDFGVPQSRRRVFIVGVHRDPRAAAEVLFEPQCGAGNSQKSRSNGSKPISPFKRVLGDLSKGPIVKGIAHCIYAESARHTGTDWSRNYVSYPDGRVRRFTPKEVEQVQGFPIDWTLPEDAKYPPERIDSLRYHAVGNAVTVPVAEWIGRRLATVLKKLDLEFLEGETVEKSAQAAS